MAIPIFQDQALLDGATTKWINDLAAQGILTTDRDLTIRSWNHWLEAHTGYEASSLLGRNLLEVFPDLVTRNLHQHYRDALGGQVRVLAQSLHRYLLPMHSDLNDARFARMQQSARIAPLIEGDRVVGTITVIDDVTERVARERELKDRIVALEDLQQALRRSEEWLSTTLRSIGDAVIATNLDGGIVLINSLAQSLTGWAEAEASGKPLSSIFRIHQQETDQQIADPLGEVLKKRADEDIANHSVLIAQDSTRLLIEWSAAPILDDHGKAAGAVLIFRDITERNKAELEIERRYQDGINLTRTNRALVGALDFAQMAEMVCSAARELIGADGSTFVLREGGRVRYAAENAVGPLWKGKDFDIEECISGWTMLNERIAVVEDIYLDERIPHDCYRDTFVRSLAMIPVGPGSPVAAIGVYWSHQYRATPYELELLQSLASATDLALAGVRAYEQARDAWAQAEQANRLKDEFLATLSHELRNPLNSIIGNTEVLLRSPEARQIPLVQRAAKVIHRNVTSQSQLINDLLDLSRLHSGKLLLNRHQILITPVIGDAVEAVRALAGARDIRLELSVPEESMVIDADPVRVQQVVWNLLSNAVKFTPNGGLVKLSLSNERQRAVLVVEDTGQGIEAAFLPHIFDMFRQADAGITRQYGGLGIGLALVKQLTELQGGTVLADSQGHGRGARFTVHFPLVTASEVIARGDPRSTGAGLKGARILVVDDSVDSLGMLNLLLSAEGADVTTAEGGREALVTALAKDFDLIVSDISMPEMDGYDLLSRLRTNPRLSAVPAIALTGFGRPEDIARAREVGFTSHITKPVDFDHLVELARIALRQPSVPLAS